MSGPYRLELRARERELHSSLPPTRCWTYGGSFPGPTVEAASGEPVTVEWENALPRRHFLPVDYSLAGCSRSLPAVRAVTHVHGARVPAASDGFPEAWSVPGQTQTFVYPNHQDAALLYYHDHTMGLNRLNVYFIRDAAEAALRLPAGEAEIPLVLCDRSLDPRGQLFYPTSGVAASPWVPEVYGNALLVNGQLWPQCEVTAGAYRFRIVNAANSRFYHLALGGLRFWQVGCDQWLLAAPVPLSALLLAPGERADVVVDFSAHAGGTLYLENDGEAMLRFWVRGHAAPAWQPPARLARITPLPSVHRHRRLTLNEYDTHAGEAAMMLLNETRWDAPLSETPRLGDTEVWELLNLTDDTHPIHLH